MRLRNRNKRIVYHLLRLKSE